VSLPNGRDRETLGLIPDKMFALQFANRPSGRETAYFFLEADRATMPVARRDLGRSSLRQKLLAYYETWRQQLHTSLFGIGRFRVLIVTTTPERAMHVVEASHTLNDGRGSGLFLLTDSTTICANQDLLTLPLHTGRGCETARLIEG
jgi:hypothetical protein